MALPYGIIPVLQTPFDDAGAVDRDSLSRLVEDAIAARVDGFLYPAVASEVAWLSPSERSDLLRHVVATINGRVPVIAGASSPDAEVSRNLCRESQQIGATACLIAVPPACYAAPATTVPFFEQAAKDCALPLVIQDLEFNGPGLSLDTMQALADALPSLAGWKIETVPSGPKYTAVRNLFGSSCHISGGWAVAQLIEALDRGVDAMIPEASMVRVYHAIYSAYMAGHRDEALRLFRLLLPVIAYTNQEIVTSIAFFKRLLVRKEIFRTETLRWPGFHWDPFNTRIADELISHCLAIEGSLDVE
ncbi:MAG TPA: dihydrodipicolinate synthase family protein [Planctomycetaceae bacterium]|nr:dihydrodipicolinate synthase family protein [Planctomycetaceae bacterium]